MLGGLAGGFVFVFACAFRYVTTSFQNRWRSLMSVDDVIDEVVSFIETEGLSNNTYFIYSSDHARSV